MVYVHKPEAAPENKTHKIILYFEIQTYHLILARRPDLVLTRGGVKINQSENIENIFTLIIAEDYEGQDNTNCRWCAQNSPQEIREQVKVIENQCDNQKPTRQKHS